MMAIIVTFTLEVPVLLRVVVDDGCGFFRYHPTKPARIRQCFLGNGAMLF